MGWWADALRSRTTDWLLAPVAQIDGAPAPEGTAVDPETSYLSAFLRCLRIVHVRRGVDRFYGAVSSCCSVPHRGGGRVEFFVIATPETLRDASAKDASRVLALNTRLLGPVPYRGGDVDLQLGLFTIRSTSLLGPYLQLVETMASAAGVAFVGPALVFVEPLRAGLRLLLGSDEPSALEVGLAATLNPVTTGVYALVGAPSSTEGLSRLTLEGSVLHGADGRPVDDHPYLVYAIEADSARSDWFSVPGLQLAYQDVVREVERGDIRAVDEALAVFRRTAVMSHDLLAADATALVARVRGEVEAALGVQPTAAASPRMPELAELRPFG